MTTTLPIPSRLTTLDHLLVRCLDRDSPALDRILADINAAAPTLEGRIAGMGEELAEQEAYDASVGDRWE